MGRREPPSAAPGKQRREGFREAESERCQKRRPGRRAGVRSCQRLGMKAVEFFLQSFEGEVRYLLSLH